MPIPHIEVAGVWMCQNPQCGLIFNWDRYHTKTVYCIFDEKKGIEKKVEKPMGGGVRPYYCPECKCLEIELIGGK